MMRRLSYCLAALCCLLLASCSTAELDGITGPCIKLTLRCDEAFVTKAGQNGERPGVSELYNENVINDVHFFFYPGKDPDRSANAVFHAYRTSGKDYTDTFLLEVTPDEVNEIFPILDATGLATVFAVVNYRGSEDLVLNENTLAGTSLERLESIVVETDFLLTEGSYFQTDFMMSGLSQIALRGRTQILTATGEVELSRYACKLSTTVHVAQEVELQDHQVWHPLLDGVELYLVNAVNTVTLGGMDQTPSEFFSYTDRRRRFYEAVGDNYRAIYGEDSDGYAATRPMYMYPQHWQYGETEGAETEPYIKLVVPWAREEINGFNGAERQLYYKIVIPDDPREECRRKFVRNNWYHLDIDVGILGAETDEAAVPVSPGSFYMVDWQQKAVVHKEVQIGSARYLSVEKDTLVLNNVNDISVIYTTSHPVRIRPGSIKATRPYYGDVATGKTTLGATVREITESTEDKIYPVGTKYLDFNENDRKNQSNKRIKSKVDWLDDSSGTMVEFYHKILNDYNETEFDYSPYTITFWIEHTDRPNDDDFARKITIIQYPAIYIEALLNTDNTFVDTGVIQLGKHVYTSDHWGYVYVDGEQVDRPDGHSGTIDDKYINYWKSKGFDYGNDKEEYHWRAVWYTGGSRNIFKINVTVLPSDSGLVIGDPRSTTIDNLDREFHTFPALYG